MFLRNISTSVQMILRCLGKERDAADEPTWKDHGRDGQERTWVIVKITITKNPILLLTRMDVRLLAMMSLEIRAEAVEPAGGCVWHVGHTRPAHKVPPRTNRQIQSAKITQIILFNDSYSMIFWNWNKVNSYISALKPLPRLPNSPKRP